MFKVEEEVAALQRVEEAPARAFLLEAKRAVVAAQKVAADAVVAEAAAIETAAAGEAVMEVANMQEERGRAPAGVVVARLLLLLTVADSAANLLLLLPLAVGMMIWMPRLLGFAAATKPQAVEKQRGVKAAIGLAAKLCVLLSATAGSVARFLSLPVAGLRLSRVATAPPCAKHEGSDKSGSSRLKPGRRKARRRKMVRRRRKLARRLRLRRRQKLRGRAKLRRRPKPRRGWRKRRRGGIARRDVDDAVRVDWVPTLPTQPTAAAAWENRNRRRRGARGGPMLRRGRRMAWCVFGTVWSNEGAVFESRRRRAARRVLSEFLAANNPVTLADLREILGKMINAADPDGKRMEILSSEDSVIKLSRWVNKQLDIISNGVPIGRSHAHVITDGRSAPVVLYPYIHCMAQVASIVANMNEAVERANLKTRQPEEEVACLTKPRNAQEPDDNATMRSAAWLLRRAIDGYSKESNKVVFDQANGRSPWTCVDPIVEWTTNVPELLVTFLDAFGHRYSDKKGAVEEELERSRASRKCLIAGVLTSFAFDSWYKNANTMGLFLKGQGIQRDGLDFLATNFKITQPDAHVYGLRSKLAGILGTESQMMKLIPVTNALVA
ncbi:unnamed protein product, partial [Pylaiella littoralis]